MSNRVQRRFKRAMNKISKQESKHKRKFYSFLENDMITSYYTKRKSKKWERRFIKGLQYLMIGILFIFIIRMIISVALADEWNTKLANCFNELFHISITVLCFGLLHPYVVLSSDGSKSRLKVLKIFGTLTVGFGCLYFIYTYFVF